MPCPNPTPDVNRHYGAPMGRHTGPNYLETCAGRLYLRRVPIDSGGYDRGGAYWGFGAPLWYVADQDGNSQFLRARSREDAKAKIRADWPDATFYR
jgi:hypothetical protein